MSLSKLLTEKPLDDLLKKSKKGGPLEKLHAAIDANDTAARTTGQITRGLVHVRDALDSKRLMFTVVVALLPALLFSFWNVGNLKMQALGQDADFLMACGYGALSFFPMYIATMVAGGLAEVAFAQVRGHEVNEGFLVTGLLIPMVMPPDAPLWMIFVSALFGIVFGKELFGGTGMNFLNPALTARAFMFFSYPAAISGDSVWYAVDMAKDKLIDGFSGATALAVLSNAERGADPISALNSAGFSFDKLFLGTIPGSFGETSTLMCLVGAAILILTGVGSWRVMVSAVLGVFTVAWLFNLAAGPEIISFAALPPHYHLVLGGFAFGAIFMATDPVSASGTNLGRWIYGFLIGGLTIVIRVANPAYPEGVMLAILFMNMFAPMLDHYVVQGNIKRRLARAR